MVVDTQDRQEQSVTESQEHFLKQILITDRYLRKPDTLHVTHVWKNVRNTVSKQLVEHHSSQNVNFCSQSDNRLERENAYKTSETLA